MFACLQDKLNNGAPVLDGKLADQKCLQRQCTDKVNYRAYSEHYVYFGKFITAGLLRLDYSGLFWFVYFGSFTEADLLLDYSVNFTRLLMSSRCHCLTKPRTVSTNFVDMNADYILF